MKLWLLGEMLIAATFVRLTFASNFTPLVVPPVELGAVAGTASESRLECGVASGECQHSHGVRWVVESCESVCGVGLAGHWGKHGMKCVIVSSSQGFACDVDM